MKPNQLDKKPKMGACFNHYDPFAPECEQCLMKDRCLDSTMNRELKEMEKEHAAEEGLQGVP